MNFFKLFRDCRERNIIRSYITRLGPMLASRYGKAEHYSSQRVRKTMEEEKLPSEEIVYALVIYCTPKDFAADQATHGGTAEYWPLRVEIMEYNFRHRRKWEPGDTGENLSSGDYAARAGFSNTDGGGLP